MGRSRLCSSSARKEIRFERLRLVAFDRLHFRPYFLDRICVCVQLSFYLSRALDGWTLCVFSPILAFSSKRFGRVFWMKDQTNTDSSSRNDFGAPQVAREGFFLCSPQTKAEQKTKVIGMERLGHNRNQT